MCRCGALTCEESEGGVRLWAHYFDPAEEGECDPVRGLSESLDVPARPGLRVPELSAGEGQDVEVRGAQLPVQLLQRPVVQLRLLAVTRHVYNQRSLSRRGTHRSDYPAVINTLEKNTYTSHETKTFSHLTLGDKSLRRFIFWTEAAGNDVDSLSLGTSPETPSCPSRLSPRKHKSRQVFWASPAESAGGINTPHRPSCSAAPSASSLSGWRTW